MIDATKTWKYPRRPEWHNEKFPPTMANAPEDVERVRRRWNEYRFTGWKGVWA